MESQQFNIWSSLVDQHLGNRMRKHVVEILHNITAVDREVKSAYLLDFGISSTDSLIHFVTNLKKNNCICSNLNIYQIGTDVLIVSPSCIKSLQEMDLESAFCVIDVSGNIEHPKQTTSKSLLSKLSHFLQNLPTDLVSVSLFDVTTDCNLTLVFGVLIGYPFVYWFDSSSDQNCLSMELLKCFEVKQTMQIKNVPRNLKPETHKIFSFSIPERVFNHSMKAHLDEWFAQKKKSDSTLNLSDRSEVLPTVAL